MQNTRTFKDKFFLILKGIAMGAANKVPGVSGGVVAFVGGFYEEFIYSLKKVNSKALLLLLKGRFKTLFNYINGKFLVLLFTGIIISFFSISKLLDYLIQRHELYVWSVFFGMIIGSIYYINREFKDWNYKTYTALVIGTLIGASLNFFNLATENNNLWFVFFCGIISVSGMTLPGFSGSFLLILLGNYVLLLVDSVNALYDSLIDILGWDFNFLQNPERIKLLKVLIVFAVGSMVGLVTFSHALSYILKHYRSITLASIIGFIIGSLAIVWPWKKTIYKVNADGNLLYDTLGNKIISNYERFIPSINAETVYAIIFILFGIALVLWLEYYGQKTRQKNA